MMLDIYETLFENGNLGFILITIGVLLIVRLVIVAIRKHKGNK